MLTSHPAFFDVVIVGAGPVGLFLACELRLANVSVLLLEQTEHSSSPLKLLPFGLRGLSAPSLESLDRRGLLETVLKAWRGTTAMAWMQQSRRPGGHFAGIQFFQEDIDRAKWTYRLPSPAPESFAVELETLESILRARASQAGVQMRRGIRISDFEATENGVIVHVGDQAVRTCWLVGCDGGRSSIRNAAGFDFVGTEPEFTGYSVQVELAERNALQPGRHYTPTGMYMYTEPGTIAMVQFDGGASHRMQPITIEHVQSILRCVSSTDVTLTALHVATTWTDRSFQAATYRKGRVLLAGDAAHIHSPLGGQGLNLGLGDAMNLGWKLASTVRGHAPPNLLDTYTAERHPIGQAILDWSRAQVALMRPTRSTRALTAIIRDLMATRDGATYFAERIWGLSNRYDLGDSHPLLGRSAPDFDLTDGRRMGELLRNGQGLLLDFECCAELQETTSRWNGRITYVAGHAKERLGLSALLVRPDGTIAWVKARDGAGQTVEQAALRWFGTPG